MNTTQAIDQMIIPRQYLTGIADASLLYLIVSVNAETRELLFADVQSGPDRSTMIAPARRIAMGLLERFFKRLEQDFLATHTARTVAEFKEQTAVYLASLADDMGVVTL